MYTYLPVLAAGIDATIVRSKAKDGTLCLLKGVKEVGLVLQARRRLAERS